MCLRWDGVLYGHGHRGRPVLRRPHWTSAGHLSIWQNLEWAHQLLLLAVSKDVGTEDTFAADLQVLARKIIANKPSFWLETNSQLKAQYVHTLGDPYYVAMAHSTPQSSLEEETLTSFRGCLVTMFGGRARQSRSSATSSGIMNPFTCF